MPLFPITIPEDKPNAFRALQAAGFPVRLQDGQVVLEGRDQAAADEAQAWVLAFPSLIAARKAAKQRLADVLRAREREDEAQTRALGLHTEALRLIVANCGTAFASWPAVTRQRMQQIAQRLQRLEDLARAADLIAADIDAMTDVAEIEALRIDRSDRWSAV